MVIDAVFQEKIQICLQMKENWRHETVALLAENGVFYSQRNSQEDGSSLR